MKCLFCFFFPSLVTGRTLNRNAADNGPFANPDEIVKNNPSNSSHLLSSHPERAFLGTSTPSTLRCSLYHGTTRGTRGRADLGLHPLTHENCLPLCLATPVFFSYAYAARKKDATNRSSKRNGTQNYPVRFSHLGV